MKPDEWADNDADTLPVTWGVDREARPCDRCPGDGDRVLWRGGREWCLCADCYQQIVLDR